MREDDFYLGAIEGQHIWLIYKPDLDWLKSPDAALTLKAVKKIAATNPDARHLAFAPARYVSQKMLAELHHRQLIDYLSGAKMAKISVDLGGIAPSAEAPKLKEIAVPLPSVNKAKASALKAAPCVQFSFTNVPKPTEDAFAAEAKRRNLSQKALI